VRVVVFQAILPPASFVVAETTFRLPVRSVMVCSRVYEPAGWSAPAAERPSQDQAYDPRLWPSDCVLTTLAVALEITRTETVATSPSEPPTRTVSRYPSTAG